MTTAERFWAKVDRLGPDECWIWQSARNGNGYGWFSIGSGHVSAHRMAYELVKGPIPTRLVIDHLCREPLCVNPAHLEAVTSRENVMRGISFPAVNVRKTHCPQGHEYTGANLYVNPSGRRICRTCARDAHRRYEARKRVAA